jgi:hypothetical protein
MNNSNDNNDNNVNNDSNDNNDSTDTNKIKKDELVSLFLTSCRNGNVKKIKELLCDSRVDPCVNNNEAIRDASKRGQHYTVRALLDDDRVDPSALKNEAIGEASDRGHVDVVKMLLGDNRVDASDDNNYAIRWASLYNHYEIVHLLMKNEKVRHCLKKDDFIRQNKHISSTFETYMRQCRSFRRKEAKKMIPFYSDAFYEKYQLPDDIMHVILGEFTFGYTTKQCYILQKYI